MRAATRSPYAVEREIEDIEALIAEAGGSSRLYGVSSGGGLVREAAAAGVAVDDGVAGLASTAARPD